MIEKVGFFVLCSVTINQSNKVPILNLIVIFSQQIQVHLITLLANKKVITPPIYLIMCTASLFHTRRHSLTIPQTINERGSPIKKRICAEYLPKYHHKLKLSNKKVLEPSQDRLTELTTKQIDRLIEMEKIKSLLNDNKKGIRPTHINFVENDKNKHPNVYQPNFIAKINRIALQRNIRHLRSQEFDEATLSPKQLRQRGLELQKKNLRFIKEYKVDCHKKVVQSYEQSQQKSISSIQDCVQDFERTLEDKKTLNKSEVQRMSKLNKFRHKTTNILSMTRWFNGMSTFYLNLDKGGKSVGGTPLATTDDRPTFDRNFDLQYENSYMKRGSKTLSKLYNSRMSTVA